MKGFFIGQTVIDVHYTTKDLPVKNEVLESDSFNLIIGGPATNAAVTFKFLGGEADLFSPLGNSVITSLALSKLNEFQLKHFNIDDSVDFLPAVSTIISTFDGSRTIITHSKPSTTVDLDIDKYPASSNSICMIDFLNTEFALELIRKKSFETIVFDAERYDESFFRLANYINILICSENFFTECNEKVIREFKSKYPNIKIKQDIWQNMETS